MGFLFGKKYSIKDIPIATQSYIKAELEKIEKAHEDNMCSGYLYAKMIAGKKR